MSRKRASGFTLIELMIVVAIIAILAAVAYPSYTAQVRSTNRSEMQGMMQDFAVTMEQYRSQHFNYTGATIAALDEKLDADYRYTAVLTPDPLVQDWVLTVTPTAGTVQDGDGVMKLDSQGQTCYVYQTNSCTLGDASQAW